MAKCKGKRKRHKWVVRFVDGGPPFMFIADTLYCHFCGTDKPWSGPKLSSKTEFIEAQQNYSSRKQYGSTQRTR